MTGQTNAVRVHQVLARSWPEPMTRDAVAVRAGLLSRAAQTAINKNLQAGVVRRVRPLDGGHGYAYTVAA